MDSIWIKGGKTLKGEIPISGAKNAALPLMAACLLSEQPLTLTNVPNLADVVYMADVLRQLSNLSPASLSEYLGAAREDQDQS